MLDNRSKNREGAASGEGITRAPVPSLPKGGGAIRGIDEKFSVNPATGTASATIPIFTSPGRAGFSPQLSLGYDSGNGNGPFGLGWNLALPSISRKTDKGIPRYVDTGESDTYLLSGAEDLVPALELGEDGTFRRVIRQRVVDPEGPGAPTPYTVFRYRPRTEGLFARIERWRNEVTGDVHWRSISRDNATSLYGTSPASRIAASGDPSRVFTWLLDLTFDDKGNAIVYEYKQENDQGVDPSLPHEKNRLVNHKCYTQQYLKRIRYANAVPYFGPPAPLPVEWLMEVLFDYGEHEGLAPGTSESRPWPVRQDPFSTYRAGFEIRTYRLCRRVLMFHHLAELGSGPTLVRATEFTFDETPLLARLVAATQRGYRRTSAGILADRAFPPVEYSYTEAQPDCQVREVDADSLVNLPAGQEQSRVHWVDLDGTGIAGLLTEQAGAWHYKRNLGTRADGRLAFGPLETLRTKPSLGELSRTQFVDLAGDGSLDLALLDGPVAGFFERTSEAGWDSFTTFASFPTVDWHNPNLRLVDLTGDGLADALVTEDSVFTWFRSEGERGFAEPVTISKVHDEEKGPALVFSDAAQSIYLADMSGDGLADIVRIRNGEVCYWPNLGYGRFGAKVTMDRPPLFDAPNTFDQRRIRLADVDGSGPTDILYLRSDGVTLWANQSGNSWSEPRHIEGLPQIDDFSSVAVLDLLGTGTACLVWSSPLPGDRTAPMRYLDLMGGVKPHLLASVKNNLGAETRFSYAPSTRFYLADLEAGSPWITRLPFPVHVVERVETCDHVSRSRFVTRYAYHHGYFDGEEREFRGFGRVDQWDTEEFGALAAGGTLATAVNLDEASHVPPVLTKTWFQVGAFIEGGRISRLFEEEYYREPGMTAEQTAGLLLEDTILPVDLLLPDNRRLDRSLETGELREAVRALRGSILRQEVYAEDGSAKAAHPYTVSERNYTVELLQPRAADNRHAVFLVHSRETIDYHYERIRFNSVGGVTPLDPRVRHELTLAVDGFGNATCAVAVAYPRRCAPDGVPTSVRAVAGEVQARTLVTLTNSAFINKWAEDDWHRIGVPAETRTYELIGLEVTASGSRFGFDELFQLLIRRPVFEEIPYEAEPNGQLRQRRLIEHVRTLYRRNDLAGPLPLGTVESQALPYENQRLAFTPGLMERLYRDRIDETVLSQEAGYVHSESDDRWWIPSGRVFYSPNIADNGAAELAFARQHFFQPRRHCDPFGQSTVVDLDIHDLLAVRTADPIGNVVTVSNDYRVLQPQMLTDSNGNRSAAIFDTLGMVAGTAIMGKADEQKGDSFDTFDAEPTQEQIDGFFDSPRPHAVAAGLLGSATSRILYDVDRFRRSHEAHPSDPSQWQPVFAATLTRETHASDPLPASGLRIQVSFSYSDGFGREIQKKVQAEPGPLVPGAAEVKPRWVGSGWTVFNNKGKPVRQYEPFFCGTHRFEFANTVGVSPFLFYDPVQRVVATLHPNHTWEKVVFDPWRQESWDVNDTVLLADPRADPDVGDFFQRLPESEFLPAWYAQRQGGGLGPHEQSAASKTAAHANTPSSTHFDTLGRPFLTIAHNGLDVAGNEQRYATRLMLDIEGNERQVIDAKERVVMKYGYDMLGNRVCQSSMEAGERLALCDAYGKPILTWNSRGFTHHMLYDALRRLTHVWLTTEDHAAELVERTVYGEAHPRARAENLRGRPYLQLDQAGVITNEIADSQAQEAFDFKGNLLAMQRTLARTYRQRVDWSSIEPLLKAEMLDLGALAAGMRSLLEEGSFQTRTTYDALNRPTAQTAPDRSVIRPTYNEANLLNGVEVNLRGEAVQGQPVWAPFVANIDYDAMGKRTLIAYGNQVRTEYEYDPLTFRLTHLRTLRGTEPLQDLSYTYDPSGNIVHIADSAQQTLYFRNRAVEPSNDYTYDAIYRLIEAAGREHLGQTNGALNTPTAPDAFNAFHTRLDHPGDGNAMGTYVEAYVYDAVGNILAVQHRGGWTREYMYGEPSLLEPANVSNRLSSTSVGNGPAETYAHDSHGNMTRMPHLPLMQWDYRDQLQATAQQVVSGGGLPETTYYVYDAAGQRVRKVTERQTATGQTPVRAKERIYLGVFEVFREYDAAGTAVTLARETLHVMDDKHRIALVETRTIGSDPAPEKLIRYQLGNHLGSTCLELDEEAQIISYEEYYPYGSTSYQAVRNRTETPKRYRYTGKERDEENGLCYHGARYYATWLGRWTASDPAGLKDGVATYGYVGGRPVTSTDPGGTEEVSPDWADQIHREEIRQSLREMGFFKLLGGEWYTSAENLYVNSIMKREDAESCIASALCPSEEKVAAFFRVSDSRAETLLASVGIACERLLYAGAEILNLPNELLRAVGMGEADIQALNMYLMTTPGALLQVGQGLRSLLKPGPLTSHGQVRNALRELERESLLPPGGLGAKEKGNLLETFARNQQVSEGKLILPSQKRSGTGSDLVYLDPDVPGTAFVDECKFISGCKPNEIGKAIGKLAQTSRGEVQLSPAYLEFQKRVLEQSANETLRRTGDILGTVEKVFRKLRVMNEKLEMFEYDMDFWDMYADEIWGEGTFLQ